MVGVPRREPLGESGRRLAVRDARRAVVLTRTGPESGAVACHGQALRMPVREPRRRGGRGGRQVGEDPVRGEQVEQTVEPVELVPSGLRLEERPGEHADRRQVHARLAHERDVLEPDLLRPLLGVVVASVEDVGDFRSETYAATLSDMFARVKASSRSEKRFRPSA